MCRRRYYETRRLCYPDHGKVIGNPNRLLDSPQLPRIGPDIHHYPNRRQSLQYCSDQSTQSPPQRQHLQSSDSRRYDIADWGNQRLQVIDSEGNFLAASRGEAIQPNPWVVEYFTGVLDEKAARDTFVPIFDVDTQDEHEISARIEPYFWDPCSVILDEQNRVYVLETCRHRFQVFERI